MSLALLALGCLSASLALLMGNRTAGVLLTSALYSSFLCAAEVPFRPALWLTIDLMAIIWIVILWADEVGKGGYGKKRDIGVIAIFGLLWPLYFLKLSWGSQAVDALVGIQMLATFPIRRTWTRTKGFFARDRGSGPMQLVMA